MGHFKGYFEVTKTFWPPKFQGHEKNQGDSENGHAFCRDICRAVFLTTFFTEVGFLADLKVHKHEIILNFLLPKSYPYMPLVNFQKKISLFILRFSPEFWSSNIFAVTEHTRNQKFLERYPKNFFFKKFTLVLLDGFLNGFSKFRFFIVEICI